MQDNNQTNQDMKMRDQAALASFVDDMMKERRDPNVNEGNWKQVQATLLKELNDDIDQHLVMLLSEKDQVALDQLLDKNPSDDQLYDFFSAHVPNLEAEIASALINFRTAYLLPAASEEAGSAPAQATQPPPLPPAPVPESNTN